MEEFTLETVRLLVRPFAAFDLEAIHRLLQVAFHPDSTENDGVDLEQRRSWLEWSRLSAEWFPRLQQPPYGDRAVVLKSSGVLVGSVGLVPLWDIFEQIPGLGDPSHPAAYNTPEVGLFWAVDPAYQRQGIASEAAGALIEYVFSHLRLKRILACTEYDNLASQGVMRRLGMRLERNPFPEPPWRQVVGVLENHRWG